MDDYDYRRNLVNKTKTLELRSLVYYLNHPIRLSQVSLSGSMSATHDETQDSSATGFADKSVYSVDFSLVNPLNRKHFSKNPYQTGIVDSVVSVIDKSTTLSDDEFALFHNATYPYHVPFAPAGMYMGATGTPAVVGTVEMSQYYRGSTSDPWVLQGSSTEDVTCYIEIKSADGGGFVRPTGSSSTLDIVLEIRIDSTPARFNLGEVTFSRDPSATSWASETTAPQDRFQDILDDYNDPVAGIASGTCSCSIDFTF